ncbi:MAG: hypothetical protein UDB11_08420 [Peptococcaceae bacterium]|nr:hypothetical protein [Peptococcaceae bacterium]
MARRGVAAVLLTAAFFLAGCSFAQYPDSEFLGTWQAEEGALGDVEVKLKDIDSRFVLTLSESGKAVLEIGERAHEGKWSPQKDDKGVTLVVDDTTTELSKIRDGVLKGPIEGVTLTFSQKGTSDEE